MLYTDTDPDVWTEHTLKGIDRLHTSAAAGVSTHWWCIKILPLFYTLKSANKKQTTYSSVQRNSKPALQNDLLFLSVPSRSRLGVRNPKAL